MKLITVFISLLFSRGFYAQEDTISVSWKNIDSITISENTGWSMDVLGNHYISDGRVLIKIDSSGAEKYRQSIKSLGNDFESFSINSMKLVLFSKDQQTICYFDNTLTSSEDCIALEQLQVENASLICPSSRPEMLWIYDNVNSTLRLFNIEKKEVQIVLTNTLGTFGLNSIDKLTERNNQLFVFGNNKVIILDLFGSLISTVELGESNLSQIHNGDIFTLKDNCLTIHNLESSNKVSVRLPLKNIKDFHIYNQYIYFRRANTVHKFRVEF